MRVLVTGGAGFIGSHVVEGLLTADHRVLVVDNLSTGRRENVPTGAGLAEVGVEEAALAAVFEDFRPEAVIHCAAQTSVAVSCEAPLADATTNILGTVNVLENAARLGVRKVVYFSSAAVYGEPVSLPIGEDHPLTPCSPYGLSKLVGEQYMALYGRARGLSWTSLRFANVYGPRQRSDVDGGVVAIFAERLAAGQPLAVHGDGEQTRDFVYVADVARAACLALSAGDGAVVNVSTQTQVTINQLVQHLFRAAGRTVAVSHGPARPGDIRHSILSNVLARDVLGWAPLVTLSEGLALTINAPQ